MYNDMRFKEKYVVEKKSILVDEEKFYNNPFTILINNTDDDVENVTPECENKTIIDTNPCASTYVLSRYDDSIKKYECSEENHEANDYAINTRCKQPLNFNKTSANIVKIETVVINHF